MQAGMSVEYYVKLERGNLRGVSEGVLGALARALRLSEEEHQHLMDLARAANSGPGSSAFAPTRRVRPALQQMLDAMAAPAWVRNGRSDFLAANALGKALYSPLFTSSVQPPNTARFVFLDPRSREYYVQWELIGQQMVASLRAEAGRNPFDRPLTGRRSSGVATTRRAPPETVSTSRNDGTWGRGAHARPVPPISTSIIQKVEMQFNPVRDAARSDAW